MLCRALSKQGRCSRSQAERWIEAGRVRVNGRLVRDRAYWVDLGRDVLAVDEERVAPAQRVYLMLNKPRGLVTTATDEHQRSTVYECLQDVDCGWIAPVGRLDRASEGLLLFTNDTGWADRLLAPASHVEKTYHVQVDGPLDEAACRRLETGIRAADGTWLRAQAVRTLRQGARNSWLECVLDEGKNRQLRRLAESAGLRVLRLIRVAVGPLPLGDLAKGRWRWLSPAEKAALDRTPRAPLR